MAAEIAQDIGQGLEAGFLEQYVLLPNPDVRLHGAAENAVGRPLANVVELTASDYHYMVLVELPQAQFSDNNVEWTVEHNGEVTIEGQITPAAIYADKPLTRNKRNRVQLCPTEPWAISFYLPGPVAWWTAEVSFTTNNFMEISVMKRNPEAGASAAGTMFFGGLADPGPFTDLDLEDDVSLSPSEIMDMVDGWLE